MTLKQRMLDFAGPKPKAQSRTTFGHDFAIAANNPDPAERQAALERLRAEGVSKERIQQLIRGHQFALTLELRKRRPR